MKSTLVVSVLCCMLPRAVATQPIADLVPDEVPLRPAIALPADDINLIAASAVQHFPELAASPGIRIADYLDEKTKDSAAVIFWPYERIGDIAYSHLGYCETSGDGQKDWICDRSDPRAYLKIHDQEKEVVIRGPVEREKALALREFAELRLQDETICTDMNQSEFLTLDPPTPRRDAYRVVWTDGASGAIVFLAKEVPQDVDAGFELVSISRSDRGHCGN